MRRVKVEMRFYAISLNDTPYLVLGQAAVYVCFSAEGHDIGEGAVSCAGALVCQCAELGVMPVDSHVPGLCPWAGVLGD